jgi:Cell division initiation protein
MNFNEERKGYSKEQVDAYIKTLNDEYLKLTEEHQKLLDTVKEEKNDTSRKDAIASAFIKAEISGKQIVSAAKLEAQKIIDIANKEVERIDHSRQIILEEVKDLSTKLHLILNEEIQKVEPEVTEQKDMKKHVKDAGGGG